MTALFIADLHLQSNDETKLQLFLDFLRQQASQAEALYILGDLFEFWIGDDDQQWLHQVVIQALRQLVQGRVDCYFMPGNRDFLINAQFASACQLTWLADPQLLTLYQVPTLLLHGDSLCTDDIAYQRLRYWLRQPWLQQLYLNLPLSWRCWLAQTLRKHSYEANQQKICAIMDVNRQAVVEQLRGYGALRMIHGHTHRPGKHLIPLKNTLLVDEPVVAERWVLGAWEPNPWVLQVDSNGVQWLPLPG